VAAGGGRNFFDDLGRKPLIMDPSIKIEALKIEASTE
jgi:hypothetical protein